MIQVIQIPESTDCAWLFRVSHDMLQHWYMRYRHAFAHTTVLLRSDTQPSTTVTKKIPLRCYQHQSGTWGTDKPTTAISTSILPYFFTVRKGLFLCQEKSQHAKTNGSSTRSPSAEISTASRCASPFTARWVCPMRRRKLRPLTSTKYIIYGNGQVRP